MSDPDREPKTRAGSTVGWWVAAIVAIIAIFGVLLLVNRTSTSQAARDEGVGKAQPASAVTGHTASTAEHAAQAAAGSAARATETAAQAGAARAQQTVDVAPPDPS